MCPDVGSEAPEADEADTAPESTEASPESSAASPESSETPESTQPRRDWRHRLRSPQLGGGALVVAVAAFVYTRYSFHDWMTRDSAIYMYGGQRVLHGQPPYVSMMDPKGPVSSLLAAVGVAVAKLLGRNDVVTVRIEFFLLALLGILGVYLLTLHVTRSVFAAVVAGIVFVGFRSFAYNAVAGPEGHLPGIVFMILMLWLTLRKQWFLAGLAAMLAFLTWQPLFIYPIVALVCAVAWSPGERGRAALRSLAGLATPVVALIVYYAWGGHLRQLLNGLIVYPLTGVIRKNTTVYHRVRYFARAIEHIYGLMAVFFWVGAALVFVAAIRSMLSARSRGRQALLDPSVLLLASTLVVQLGYISYDYIGFPHTFTVLPYAAFGIGWGLARGLDRLRAVSVRWSQVAVAVAAVVAVVIAVGSAISYSSGHAKKAGNLITEEAGACGLQRALVPGTPLWVIDNPGPLVLLHRRQPDNFPYVGGGLDVWKVHHTKHGFEGWMHEIKASHTSLVVFESWVKGPYKDRVKNWLRSQGFRSGSIGPWKVFVDRAGRAWMRHHGLILVRHQHGPKSPLTGSNKLTVTHCPAPSTRTKSR